MKNILLVFIIFFIFMSLTACGKQEENTPSATPENTPTAEPSVPSVDDAAHKELVNNIQIIDVYTSQLINSKINNPEDYSAGGFTWDTEAKKDSWRYFNGVMLEAFAVTGREENLDYVRRFLDSNLSEDGTPKNYHSLELDSVPMGLSLFYLLDTEQDAKARAAIQYIYSELEKQTSYDNCGGNYLHKTSWKTYHIGLDGLYMAQTFLLKCASYISGNKLSLVSADGTAVSAETLYDEIFRRLHWVAETMYDDSTSLYHHGWNVETGKGNGHFWLRGIGWYAVALAKAAAEMPDASHKEQLTQDLIKLFDGMLKYCDSETGLWYNVVNAPALTGNRLETSGSAMMAYALLIAYCDDLVDSSYADAGIKAFNSIVSTKVTTDSKGNITVKDIYQKSGVCDSDSDYTVNKYVNDEAKGTGILIMAAQQAKIYLQKAAKITE